MKLRNFASPGPAASAPDRLPTLAAPRLRLRWIEPGDLDELYGVFSDPDVMRYWSHVAWPHRDEAAIYLESIHRGFERGDLMQWGISLTGSDEVIGTTTLASVAGGLFGYAIGYYFFETVGEWVVRTYGMQAGLEKFRAGFAEWGTWIILIKGATPIPFKLLTITAGFIAMPLLVFIGASIISRAISFMIVGVLFRLFGAPIKRFIDRYLGLVTVGFVVLVVGGFVAATMLGGGSDTSGARAKCEQVSTVTAS